MSKFRREPEKDWRSGLTNVPVNKRPRAGSSSDAASASKYARAQSGECVEDDDDPFADDLITGEELEEWESIATQAEVQLTQGQVNGHRENGVERCTHGFEASRSKVNKTDGSGKTDAAVRDLRAKLAAYENKVKELERSFTRKDGETRILRDRLSRTEKDLSQEKVKLAEVQKQYAEAEITKEKQIQKEIEKYKDQVQFKHAEIMESQNLIRNLETKNRQLLEAQKTKASNNAPSCSKASFNDTGWSNSPDVKKIRLVKPESPRVQQQLKKATFDDEPFGRKKTSKPSPSKPVESITPSTLSNEAVCLSSLAKLKLRSKYISREKEPRILLNTQKALHASSGSPSHVTLKELLASGDGEKSPRGLNTASDLVQLLSGEATGRDTHAQASALEGVRKLLSSPTMESYLFRRSTGVTDVNKGNLEEEGYSQMLLLIENALHSYVTLLNDMACTAGSSVGSSFYSAVSTPSKMPPARTGTDRFTTSSCASKCERAYVAIKTLKVLLENSQSLRKEVMSKQSVLSSLLKLCDWRMWDQRLPDCRNITSSALQTLRIISGSFKDDPLIEKFLPLMKSEVLHPLVTSDDPVMAGRAAEVARCLVSHRPFAELFVADDKTAETPSLLSHVCDLCLTKRDESSSEDDQLDLLLKVTGLLSELLSEQEDLLVEHSCYSEIYHAMDVLLYDQLVSWKKDATVWWKRVNLIRQAICLLYSCTNVYTEGVPGNRREHRHIVVLTEMEHFLARHGDQTTFWCQELLRTVKAEVTALYEEAEVT